VEVVWAVVTEPEQISGWVSGLVELDLRRAARRPCFDGTGTGPRPGRRDERPRVSRSWERRHAAEVPDGNLLLVAFTLP